MSDRRNNAVAAQKKTRLAIKTPAPATTKPGVERGGNATWASRWDGTNWMPGLAGAVLLWAALPPVAWGWLAAFALAPWMDLVQRPNLAGKKPYRTVWCVGFVYWLAAVHWLRLPHPITHLGWLALAGYLACYVPAFIGLSRVAVHRLHCPLWLAGPVVWAGLELLRGHLLTGFGMALLGHSFVDFPVMIQAADLGGAYLIGFLLASTSALLAVVVRRAVEERRRRPDWRRTIRSPIACGLCLWGLWYGYGAMQLRAAPSDAGSARIGVVQGSVPQTLKSDRHLARSIVLRHLQLTDQAAQQKPDVIVWPETMWRYAMSAELGDRVRLGGDWTEQDVDQASRIMNLLPCPLLLGVDVVDMESSPPRRFNSAVLVDTKGRAQAHYHKVHRVMFGEYIPFAESFPWLYQMTPLTGGIQAGAVDQVPITLPGERSELGKKLGVRLAPDVCYESTVPHLIRAQTNAAIAQGTPPDVLVNLTNDAWFWGSSELDMHLACGVFRAVECRRPFVAAANNGLSAVIDGAGRKLWVGPRQAEAVQVVDVPFDGRASFYLLWGDAPWWGCLACCVGLALFGGLGRRSIPVEPGVSPLNDQISPSDM